MKNKSEEGRDFFFLLGFSRFLTNSLLFQQKRGVIEF